MSADFTQATMAENTYSTLVETFLRDPEVMLGSPDKRALAHPCCKSTINFFAMLSQGRFVVKLPRQRVDELIEAGKGERFDPGHGRLMKEWLVVHSVSQQDWLTLAQEAKHFVASAH